jgi:hypothetical protein
MLRRLFERLLAMDGQVFAALVAGLVALIVAIATGVFSARNSIQIEKLKTKAEAEQRTSHYSHPLARSAYELKNRFSNILFSNFMGRWHANGSPQNKKYAIENTAFVTAQFLCWSEIVRRDIQYLDMQEIVATRKIGLTRAAIAQIWRNDNIPGEQLRLFSGEQQEAGEVLQRRAIAPGIWECMGYSEFLDTFSPRGTDAVIDQIKDDLRQMNDGPAHAANRMSQLHCKLKEPIAELDPQAVIEPEKGTGHNVFEPITSLDDKADGIIPCRETLRIGPWPWD